MGRAPAISPVKLTQNWREAPVGQGLALVGYGFYTSKACPNAADTQGQGVTGNSLLHLWASCSQPLSLTPLLQSLLMSFLFSSYMALPSSPEHLPEAQQQKRPCTSVALDSVSSI